nr:alpha/beta hydrolase [Mangrovactinospora gilvigrisea]
MGLNLGLAVVGAAAGVAAERLTVGLVTRRRARAELDAVAPFGTLRGTPHLIEADDGTELYAEVEEADPAVAGEAPVTVVFSHGYCLDQDSWHFQRAALRGRVRMVFWDQRSHGRSGRGPLGDSRFERLARDLHAVVGELAPDGPLVLAGHSMGGMTVMALAAHDPELFAERVAGVALLSTTAGQWASTTLGLPGPAGRLVLRTAPAVLKLLGRQPALVERARRLSADAIAPFVKRYSFASDVDPAVARFAERMIEETPVDVVAEFLPAFYGHDTSAALEAFAGIPALVLHGDGDLLVPPDQGAAIADAVPGARFVLVEEAGHLVLLERPAQVDAELVALIEDASTTVDAEQERTSEQDGTGAARR